MPVHHQSITHSAATHAHTFAHVDMRASRLNTRVDHNVCALLTQISCRVHTARPLDWFRISAAITALTVVWSAGYSEGRFK